MAGAKRFERQISAYRHSRRLSAMNVNNGSIDRSPRRATTAICAHRTAGVDVSLPFAITAERDSRHFSLSDRRMKP
jgi:hypothetical protein